MAQCRADPRRKGSVLRLFQGVALLDLRAIWVSKRDADLAATPRTFLSMLSARSTNCSGRNKKA